MVAAVVLEREVDVAALTAALQDARVGRGVVVVIEGEAGVGKSTLLEAARLEAHRAGLQAMTGRGSELERGFSFGLARQLSELAQAVPDFLDAPGSAAVASWSEGYVAIQGLFEIVSRLAADRPLMLSIDDVQWADEPSLRFLAYLAARAHELPLVLVCALNTGEIDPTDVPIAALRGSAGVVIDPRPLSLAAVRTLVGSVLGSEAAPGVAEACLRVTGGNPFYLRELLQTISASPADITAAMISELVPPRVLRSVMLRLGRLGAGAASLGRAAAILGDGAPLYLAARLAGLDLSVAGHAADALAGAGIFVSGDPLHFAHPMLAAAISFDMGHFERGRAHRQAAALLETQAAPTGRIAAHLLRTPSGADRRVVEVLEQAAVEAIQFGDPNTAVQLLDRALDEPPSADAQPQILLAAAKAEALTGSAGAVPRLEQALALVPPGELRVAAMIELASLLRHGGQFRRAVELARRGRAEMARDHPRYYELQAVELTSAAMLPVMYTEVRAAIAALRDDALVDRSILDRRLRAMIVGLLSDDSPVEQIRELALDVIAGDPLMDDSHGISVGWVAHAFVMIDELEPAEQWLDMALSAAEQRGAMLAAGVAALNRATVRYHRGRLDLAVVDAGRALDLHRCGWTSSPWSAPILARAHLARGEHASARGAISIGEQGTAADAPDRCLLLAARAELRLAEGDPRAALRDAHEAGEALAASSGFEQPRLVSWRGVAARAAHQLGLRDEANELMATEVDVLRRLGPARQLGAALTVAGVVAVGPAGLALLAEANEVLASSPAHLQRAESLLEFGAALRRSGEQAAAREPLYAALELAADCGAEPITRRARDELASLGFRPRRNARTGIAALTARERGIAELAAAGRSTPEIAAELHLSRNTVETHLSHVYRKLTVSGRVQLRALLKAARESA